MVQQAIHSPSYHWPYFQNENWFLQDSLSKNKQLYQFEGSIYPSAGRQDSCKVVYQVFRHSSAPKTQYNRLRLIFRWERRYKWGLPFHFETIENFVPECWQGLH